jgi:hypothetical protein
MTDVNIRPLQSLKKICLHWTAGPSTQTGIDHQHYHFIVDGRCVIHEGRFRPQDNIPPLSNGHYAAHCGGGNSWCIGVALCGMAGYVGPGKVGKYPLT